MAAETDGRIKNLEGELSLLKNQIQQTLLDVREHVLELTNPFSNARAEAQAAQQPVVVAVPQAELSAPAPQEAPQEPMVEPEPVPEPEPEPIVETPAPGLDSFDALMDAPAAPGYDDPNAELNTESWEQDQVVNTQRSSRERAPVREPEPMPELNAKLDLITLTSLVKWVDQTARKIGKERVLVILDIYEMAGRISPTNKQLVQRLCALTGGEDEAALPLRDVVGAMLQIDGLLEAKQGDERRLLSLLVDNDFDPFQLTTSRNGFH